MATDDDDFLAGPVPEPDAEPSATERAHARTFGELVDKTLAGRTPPAMSADDRARARGRCQHAHRYDFRRSTRRVPRAPARRRQAMKYVLLLVLVIAVASCSADRDAPPPSVTQTAEPAEAIGQRLMVALSRA